MTHPRHQPAFADPHMSFAGDLAGRLPAPEDALARSRPRPRLPIGPILLVGLALGMAALFLAAPPGGDAPAAMLARLALLLAPLAVLTALFLWGNATARRFRTESSSVARLEDSARLDSFDSVVPGLTGLLSAPMLSPELRLRALFVYVAALVRVGRFDDALRAADRLLEEGTGPEMLLQLKSARVYALLREDRLHDADQALTELKRIVRDLGAGHVTAFTALTEAYREVRTGNTDAILDSLSARRELCRRFIGKRLADLEAFAAWAFVHRGDRESGQAAWATATLLDSPSTLVERYPEVGSVARLLAATPLPPQLRPAGPAAVPGAPPFASPPFGSHPAGPQPPGSPPFGSPPYGPHGVGSHGVGPPPNHSAPGSSPQPPFRRPPSHDAS